MARRGDTNARDEFIRHVANRTVKCATIGEEEDSYRLEPGEKARRLLLPVGYTPEQYEDYLKSLNFQYDSGYGGQNLFGTIWYTDGSWSERGEYDGSEWWEHREMPAIPEELAPTFDNGPDTLLIEQ